MIYFAVVTCLLLVLYKIIHFALPIAEMVVNIGLFDRQVRKYIKENDGYEVYC